MSTFFHVRISDAQVFASSLLLNVSNVRNNELAPENQNPKSERSVNWTIGDITKVEGNCVCSTSQGKQ